MLTGRTLGDFVLRAPLGEGGQGVVYRAEQPALGREAVVKVVRGEGGLVQRFLREARLASKLDHPYAAHVYAFGAEPDGLLWIAMELVRGTPLDRVLAAQGPMPLERFVPFFERLCEVVHTAHEQGIVHRDLKPANVMVIARAGRVLPKLIDLGIAKSAAEPPTDLAASDDGVPVEDAALLLTQRGEIVGSPRYMAPEQWINAPTIDARTDIYALGILAYEVLTGRPPFTGATMKALAWAHKKNKLPGLDGLPPALYAALATAVAKKQEDRYATALDLAVAVRAGSGLEAEREALPRLDEETRAAALTGLPQPIADAVAALDSARNGHQARDAIWEIGTALCHVVGVLALACRSRLAGQPDSELLLALTRRGLSEAEWLELARQVCRPYAREREVFPIPELVSFVLDGAGELEALVSAERSGSYSEEQLRPILTRQLAALGSVLAAVGFLADYPWLAGEQRWMGTRRPAVGEGEVAVVDEDGHPLVRLSPLAQVHAPTPGAPAELFLFAGKGRRGARLIATPRGFEHSDESLWDWFRENLLAGNDPVEASAVEVTPYRGLAAFSRDDAALFFGREAETEAFLNRLRVTPLLAVVGPSGAGKSSFVEAGVIPGLDPGWRVLSFRPGATPLANLRARLAEVSGPTLLVVDQAEELFTLCLDEVERRTFAAELVAAARDPLRVVLTLRDDFLIRATELGPFRQRIGQGLQLLTTPAREDLLRILTLPAERAGYRFEDADLPARMVDSVAGQPGALALLSFTAARLWELRDRHFKQLGRKAYDAIGGVAGALAQHAESVRNALPPDEQRLLRDAFRALVTAEGTRAVLSRRGLLEILGDTPAAAHVVDRLIAARLLVTSENESGATVEVIHEALLVAWPRLVDWRREDAEGARLRDQLRAASRQWDDRGRARGLLWRDEALAEYRLWRARYPGQLTAVEAAFGDASVADARRARRNRGILIGAIFAGLSVALVIALFLRDDANKARGEVERNYVRLLQDQGRRLLLEDDVLHAYPYLAAAWDRGGPNPALRYMLGRAVRMLEQQVAVLPHDGQIVQDVLFTPDGNLIVSADWGGAIKVWDRTGRLVRQLVGHRDPIFAIVMSPDGQRLASSDRSGRVLVWRLMSGEIIDELPGRLGGFALAWSPDGARIAAGGRNGPIILWNASARRVDGWLLGHTRGVRGLQFVGGGSALVSAGLDGRVLRWSADGVYTSTLTAAGPGVQSLTTTRDGLQAVWVDGASLVTSYGVTGGERRQVSGHGSRTWWAVPLPSGEVVTAGDDGVILVWEAGTPSRALPLVGHSAAVRYVAASPDGQRFLSTSDDGSTIIWDLAQRQIELRLSGHTATVRRGAFDPRGELLVTASLDGTARLWRPSGIDRVAQVRAHRDDTIAFALDPARKQVALVTSGNRLLVQDVPSLQMRASIELSGEPRDVEWDPSGRSLVVLTTEQIELRATPSLETTSSLALADGSRARFSRPDEVLVGRRDGSVLRWTPTAPAQPWLTVQGEVVAMSDVADGQFLVGTREGEVTLWTLEGRRAFRLQLDLQASGVWLDRDIGRIYVAGGDSSLRTWDLAGNPRPTLEGHANSVSGVARLAPSLLITASEDGTLRVWDEDSGVPLAVLMGAGSSRTGVAVGRDGTWFYTASTAGQTSAFRVTALDELASRRRRLDCLAPFVLMGETLRRINRVDCDQSPNRAKEQESP